MSTATATPDPTYTPSSATVTAVARVYYERVVAPRIPRSLGLRPWDQLDAGQRLQYEGEVLPLLLVAGPLVLGDYVAKEAEGLTDEAIEAFLEGK